MFSFNDEKLYLSSSELFYWGGNANEMQNKLFFYFFKIFLGCRNAVFNFFFANNKNERKYYFYGNYYLILCSPTEDRKNEEHG